jgi:hypothetical protein
MQEEWIRWKPIEGLAEKYDIDYILDGTSGLIIRLYDDKNPTKKIDVIFEQYADSYRHTKESFRSKLIHSLDDKYGNSFYAKGTFFKVTGSEYIKWLSEASSTYSEMFPLTHFSILGVDSVVDVIARYEPTVIMVD